jgi:hypothetical protein
VDIQDEEARGVHLREQMLRQAVRHGVADGIAGVTRLQIVDEVYDEDYWSQYRAGLAGWRESEHGGRQAARPRAYPRHQAGEPHPDATQTEAGWHANDRGLFVRNAGPAAGHQPDVPFAVRLLGELEASGEWNPPARPTVTHDRHSEAMCALDRQWLAPTHDGPEAG